MIVECLTLIWVGFLWVRFEVGGKIISPPVLVRIMLETSSLVLSTHSYVVSENIPFSA